MALFEHKLDNAGARGTRKCNLPGIACTFDVIRASRLKICLFVKVASMYVVEIALFLHILIQYFIILDSNLQLMSIYKEVTIHFHTKYCD